MTIVHLLLIFIFSFILIKSADIVIVALKSIARHAHAGVFALSAIILALGTSLPELFVGITSSLEGTPSLSMGNVLGANIANISLVTGLSALMVRRVSVSDKILHHEVVLALLAGTAPLLLVFDKELDSADGLILLGVYGIYITSLFKTRFTEIANWQTNQDLGVKKILRHLPLPDGRQARSYAKLLIGVTLLLVAGRVIVVSATSLATDLGIPIFLVGLIVLSIGTTLPEIVFSFKALKDHEPSMFFGNLLGSIITNSTLILGVVALITPIKIVAIGDYLTAIISFTLIFFLFWFFVRSKHRLERWEAVMLLALYVIFIFIEFLW